MRTLARYFLILGGFAFAACNAASPDSAAALQDALEQDFGALTESPEDQTESEDPDANAAAEELDRGEAGPHESEPPIDRLPAELEAFEAAGGKAYFLRVAWGNFPPNKDGRSNPVDYSGAIGVDSDAALRRVRAWRMEKSEGIVRPRTDKGLVELTSTIYGYSDGLHLLVLAPAGTGTLTIKLGAQFDESYDLAAIDHLREENPSATAGQLVRVAIDRIKRGNKVECMSGSLVGRWLTKQTKNGREVARLVGRVLGEDGQVHGKVVGIAGERKNGRQVFFLKILGDHRLIARVRGTYDPSANTFTGVAFGPGGKLAMGSVEGVYTIDAADPKGGTFEGSFSVGRACGDPANE